VTFDGFEVRAKGLTSDTFAMNIAGGVLDSTITVTHNKLQGADDPDSYDYGVYCHRRRFVEMQLLLHDVRWRGRHDAPAVQQQHL